MADFKTGQAPCLFCAQLIDARAVRCIHCMKEVVSTAPASSKSSVHLKLTIAAAAVSIISGAHSVYTKYHPGYPPTTAPTFTSKELEVASRDALDADKADDRSDTESSQGNYNKQRMNETISQWTRIIEKNPRNAQAYLERGWAYNEIEEYENAVYDLSKAISLNPRSADAYSKRAWVEDTRGEFNRALKDASRAIKLDSKNSDAYEARACAYASLGDSKRASADSERSEQIKLSRGL